MLYFAYGSNMDPRQIKIRCPSARFVSIAALPDYKLAFTLRSQRRRCGVANVVPKAGEEVLGVLYRINSLRDWKTLDRAEGFNAEHRRGNRYTRIKHRIRKLNGYPPYVNAFIYVGLLERYPPRPSRSYIAQMIVGANKWKLSSEYRDKLKSISHGMTHS